nr:PREDICTED: uncharacterized protein LOC103567809 isoform X2 [Equus przewalskii]
MGRRDGARRLQGNGESHEGSALPGSRSLRPTPPVKPGKGAGLAVVMVTRTLTQAQTRSPVPLLARFSAAEPPGLESGSEPAELHFPEAPALAFPTGSFRPERRRKKGAASRPPLAVTDGGKGLWTPRRPGEPSRRQSSGRPEQPTQGSAEGRAAGLPAAQVWAEPRRDRLFRSSTVCQAADAAQTSLAFVAPQLKLRFQDS